ncbi:Oidioi.mRNA.OKI2018_I69.chr2.g5111.t1.cds [Oikopleura dioica]|uniref:Oidioi.mRNA.OKI2018_I69.chr2.g5111.t1.cds n=1 Tax=Oikopleura dioica TaxID=34765 RepID=A0ABN7T3R1_OIKDI|nr:Oidioi.mRNA.OKI2018_I69.chr2.g5111.t1.cds [Oikopleura dioica]
MTEKESAGNFSKISSVNLQSESYATVTDFTENDSKSSFTSASEISEEDSDGNVLFVQEKPKMNKIELGAWKNASLNDTSFLSEESGNEDPVKESFASIDHAEMVRLRYEARQNDPPRINKPTIVQTSTLLSQISESPYSLNPLSEEKEPPAQVKKPLKIDKVVEITYPKGQKPLKQFGRKPVIPIQDPKELLFDITKEARRESKVQRENGGNVEAKKMSIPGNETGIDFTGIRSRN